MLLGCDPDSEPVGEGPESESATDTTTGSTSGGSTSGVSMSSTSVGDSTTSVGTTEASSEETGSSDGTTGGGQACEFEASVIEFAENGKVLPRDVIDCGSLPLGSEAQAYQDMQDCILESGDAGLAYYAFIELQGIDSEVWRAYSGSPGLVYAQARWGYDNYFGDEQLWMTSCNPAPNGDPMCVPGSELGLCLVCEGDSVQVCPSGR